MRRLEWILLIMGALFQHTTSAAEPAEASGITRLLTCEFKQSPAPRTQEWTLGKYNGGDGTLQFVATDGAAPGSAALRLAFGSEVKGMLQAHARPYSLPIDGKARKLRLNIQYLGGGLVQVRFVRKENGKQIFLRNAAGHDVIADCALPAAAQWQTLQREWPLSGELFQEGIQAWPLFQVYAPEPQLQIARIELSLYAPAGEGGPIVIQQPQALSPEANARRVAQVAPFQLTTQGRCFLKNGKPTYLLGTLGAEWGVNSLWLRRLLGYDYYSIGWHDGLQARVDKAGGQERLILSFQDPQPLFSYCAETVRNRLLPQLIFCGSHEYGPLRNYQDRFPAMNEFFSHSNHSMGYDFNAPLGRELYRGGFANALRYVDRLPLLAYEIYREPGYMPTGQRARDGFRSFAQKKYSTIAAANRAWRTQFSDWPAVQPPHLIGASLLVSWRDRITNMENVYQNRPEMYHDWLEYLRDDFYQGDLALKNEFRKLSAQPLTHDCRTQRYRFNDGYASVDPELTAQAMDQLFCHTAYTFYDYAQKPADPQKVLATLLTSGLYHDYLSHNTDKPIINTENIVSYIGLAGDPEKAMESNCFGKFHGQARFKLVKTAQEVAPEWSAPGFDDSSWGMVKVPGAWDESGPYKGQLGWGCYRFHFKMPAGLAQQNYRDGTCRYLIYGMGVAQKGTLWLNGQLVGKPEGWNTKYQYDVSGLLNFGGDNTLVLLVDGSTYYYEGIRSYLHLLASNQLQERKPAERKHYASMIWSNLMHGCSGNTYWHWDNYVHWYMPELKAAADSAAPLTLAHAGPTGTVAMLYSFEGNQGMLSDSSPDDVDMDYLNYYGAMTFLHVPTDILSCRKLLEMPKGRYPVLLAPYAKLIRGGCFARIERFVNEGGTLIVTHDSLLQEDQTYEHLPVESLAGITLQPAAQTAATALRYQNITYPLVAGGWTQTAGRHIATAGAEVIAMYDDGTPAITRKRQGEGSVYYIAARLDFSATHEVLAGILREAGMKAPLEVRSAGANEFPYIEARMSGTPQRFVLYVQNWGGTAHNLTIKLEEESYRLADYDIRDINAIASGVASGPRYVRDAGVSLVARPQEPVALLFEKRGASPYPLQTVSAQKREVLGKLAELARNPQKPSGLPQALFLGDLHGEHRNSGLIELFPIVAQLLRLNGYETWSLTPEELTPERLQQFALVILAEESSIPYANLLKTDFVQHFQRYINNGGSCLLLFSSNGQQYNSARSALFQKLVADSFGATQDGWCESPVPGKYGDSLQIRSETVIPHPITENMKALQFFVASAMGGKQSVFKPVVLAPKDDLRQPQKALALTAEIGKGGRMVVVGDTLWAQPERVEEADNLQFLDNIINWLGHREPVKRDKDALIRQLPVTAEIWTTLDH